MIGLFHRAIAQSGSALSPWAAEDPSLARSKAFRLGEALGCKTSDSDVLLEFLMKVPAQNIVEGFDKAAKEEVSVSSFIVTGKFVLGLDNIETSLTSEVI
jgi:carboxylesterase type B